MFKIKILTKLASGDKETKNRRLAEIKHQCSTPENKMAECFVTKKSA